MTHKSSNYLQSHFSLTDQVRRELLHSKNRKITVNSKNLPNLTQYALMVGCSPQYLSKFTKDRTRAMGHALFDALCAVTGVAPFCPSSKILHHRRINASLYWSELELQIKYPHVTTYFLVEERKLLQKLEEEHANNARSIAENWFSDSESASSIWIGV